MSVTGRTDFVVIDDESSRGPPQTVAVGLGERVPLIRGQSWQELGKVGIVGELQAILVENPEDKDKRYNGN